MKRKYTTEAGIFGALCTGIAGVVLTMSATSVLAERSFSRYQVILDRKPFGEVPEEPSGPVGPIRPAAPPFISELRMCAISENVFGTRVGFVNIKTERSYYLYVGENEDGILVVKADYEKEGALLRKGAEEYWIYMDGSSVGQPGGAVPGPGPRPVSQENVNSGGRNSYAERLRKRREALRHRKVEPPQLSGEELQKHLQEYQMDLIRKGDPPLPMPLTKEMDDQLVAEGVLPPIEEE